MKPVWRIYTHQLEPDNRELIKAAVKAGHEVYEVELQESGRTIYWKQVDTEFVKREQVSVDGLPKKFIVRAPFYELNGLLADSTLQVVMFGDIDKDFDVTAFKDLKQWINFGNYTQIELGKFKANPWDYYINQPTDSLFVRPVSGQKLFTGQVVPIKEHGYFTISDVYISKLPKETQIIIAATKKVKGEWRFVVDGEKVLSSSCYSYNGESLIVPNAPQRAEAKAVEVMKEMKSKGNIPAGIFVLDIGLVDGHLTDPSRAFVMIETNCFNTSGLYACDCKPIVEHIEKLWNDLESKEAVSAEVKPQ